MELGCTIRKRRKQMGLTLDELSDKAGCSKPYLSTIERGKVKPPAETLLSKLERILGFEEDELVEKAFMERLPARLRNGIESYKTENSRLKNIIKALSKKKNEEDVPAMLSGHDFSTEKGFVPVINRVSAGYPTDFDDLGYPVGYADDYIKCPDLADPNAFAVRIVGDSMVPEYSEGDIVVFSPSRTVDNGDDCFVRFKHPHETTFKRVYFQIDGSVMLQPRNTDYPPFIVDNDRINGIYKAVRKYQIL
ncbi:MAG: helix-turn-helix domain-containing protein [Sedimentisphaeraceae bacterium JB056]